MDGPGWSQGRANAGHAKGEQKGECFAFCSVFPEKRVKVEKGAQLCCCV